MKRTFAYITLITLLALNTSVLSAMEVPEEVSNPILAAENLADPHMLRYQGKYYLYGTYLDGSMSAGSDHYDAYVSADMHTWDKVENIFQADSVTLWAPDVFYDPLSKMFYLYYSNQLDIGIATSNSPTGPFEDKGILIENAIDAHMYSEDGQYYLYYSSVDYKSGLLDIIMARLTGNKGKENILVQRMSSPLSKVGAPQLLLEPTDDWEQGFFLDITEGAWMYKHADTYYLMYSGGETMFGEYALGYATSSSPLGPFAKHSDNPILRTTSAADGKPGIFSPGHHSVIRDEEGTDWVIYHQKKSYWDVSLSRRYTCRDRLLVDDQGRLVIQATGMSGD
ncbi:glycoside hydrolase family 43 protein [Pseudomonas sp. N040]|uniref:glycoside hydrolase family 43 protein n=1 Tax=Pseudomonas sp. N040 TaxID=2785325 RepID=UPI0018A31FF1|nr:glycoside hydrolase family 43 protein [Pseudomonas sp. N040]MBF7729278.1 glycoside hydrolase family 43 protein [Pseudomonas sp. N040]MBW7012918.1 glycoside hydrolase family 43 protein [Pseudomonas sp. N040]